MTQTLCAESLSVARFYWIYFENLLKGQWEGVEDRKRQDKSKEK
jgi:hypothetical protein